MSADNSVVDSSVTEWKPDAENKNNQEEQDHSCEQVGTSNANKGSDARYFIIKSLNHENIQLSIEKGIWATQVMNEPILEEAYHSSSKVILIFSVNMSGFFQGYAQMTSSVGWRRDNVWSNGHGGSRPWGRSFKVKWLRLHDLPFQKTLHLKNPLNHYKPVKISRDCQELPGDIGEALCELIDAENAMDENQISYDYSTGVMPPEGPCAESFCGLQEEEYDVNPMNMAPLIYPTMFYPHTSEASRFHVAPQTQAGPFHISNAAENTDINAGVDMGGDSSVLYDGWDMASERNLHANALTDDDILEMTYEEYLEAHGRGSRISHQPVKESSRRSRESSASKEQDDEAYSRSRSKKSRHHRHVHDK